MRSRALPGVVGALLALAVVAATGVRPVAAQAGEGMEDARYQRALEEAVAEYGAGRYAEARALFRQAHEISPSARTLRGIGMSAFELREYAEAMRALEAALASEARPLTAEQRRHAEGLIQRTDAFLGRYSVTLSPEGATLRVDGRPAQLEDGSLLLDLGRHELEASCPGCRPATRTVVVRGGERETVAFALARDVGDEGSAILSDPRVGPAPTHTAEARPSGGSGASPALLYVGAGLFAIGAAAGAIWWIDRNDEIDVCAAAGPACTNDDTLKVERGVAVAVTFGFGAAAVAALIAGLLSGGDDEEGLTVACAPGPMGVGCAGRF